MNIVVVMPQGAEDEWAALDGAGSHVTFGTARDARFVRLPEDDLIALCSDADCLVFNVVSRRLVESLPKLTTVVSPYVGYDKIDVAAATEVGVLVCNTQTNDNVAGNAEAAIALLLASAKRLRRRVNRLHGGGWSDDQDRAVLLAGSTVGIVGLGRIGSAVARRLAGWDVRLLAHTRTPNAEIMRELEVEHVDLPTLLRESDFVTLHVPLTLDTQGMIGEAALRSMKPSAYLINTARGLVVDEQALRTAIEEEWIAGAALDVFVHEPLPVDSPLRSLDPERLLLTPHALAHTETARRGIKHTIIESVLTALDGRLPALALNPEVFPRWRGRRWSAHASGDETEDPPDDERNDE